MENEKLLAKNLFDYSRTIAKPLLETVDYPWEALPKISEFIIELGKTLDPEIYEQRGENVWVAKSAKKSAFMTPFLLKTANARLIRKNATDADCVRASAALAQSTFILRRYKSAGQGTGAQAGRNF